MKDLSLPWRSATEIDKPESLIGKHCREKKSGSVLLIERYSNQFGYYVCRTSEKYIKHCFSEDIEYLDESPEAIREILKEPLENAYGAGKIEHKHVEFSDGYGWTNFETWFNKFFNL